jgi:hypothetical protein
MSIIEKIIVLSVIVILFSFDAPSQDTLRQRLRRKQMITGTPSPRRKQMITGTPSPRRKQMITGTPSPRRKQMITGTPSPRRNIIKNEGIDGP